MMKVSIFTCLCLSFIHVNAFVPHPQVHHHLSRPSVGLFDVPKENPTKANGEKVEFDIDGFTKSISRVIEVSNIDVSAVTKNIKEGELGSRGEVYFAAQLLLIVLILLGGLPVFSGPLHYIVGPSLILAGLSVSSLGAQDLGNSITPLPKPIPKGLKTQGIYAQMRHPMYAGLLCIMFGLSILTNSADRLLLTILLGYLVEVKSTKEEEFLTDVYGNEYTNYKRDVPQKFLPNELVEKLPWK